MPEKLSFIEKLCSST